MTGVAATFFCEPMVSFVCIFFNIWIWFRLFLNTICMFRDHRVLNNLSVLLNIGCSSASQYWLLGNSAMAYILVSHVAKLILLAAVNIVLCSFCSHIWTGASYHFFLVPFRECLHNLFVLRIAILVDVVY